MVYLELPGVLVLNICTLVSTLSRRIDVLLLAFAFCVPTFYFCTVPAYFIPRYNPDVKCGLGVHVQWFKDSADDLDDAYARG